MLQCADGTPILCAVDTCCSTCDSVCGLSEVSELVVVVKVVAGLDVDGVFVSPEEEEEEEEAEREEEEPLVMVGICVGEKLFCCPLLIFLI